MKKIILWLIVAITLCSGCKTTQKVQREIVYQYEEVHDTIRDISVQIVRDSIYLHDSIVVVQDTTGKVIYREKYVYRDLWHDGETKVVHDSIVVYKDKSESNIESKEVVEKRSWWKDLLNYLEGAIVGLVIGVVTLFFVRKL